MSPLSEAIALDVAGQFVDASVAYESVTEMPDAPLAAYINLAVLYWQCADFGLGALHHLPVDFVQKAGRRFEEVLDAAETRHGPSCEVIGWRDLMLFLELNAGSIEEHCQSHSTAELCEPCLLFHVIGDRSELFDVSVLDGVLNRALTVQTTKSRYVASIVDAYLQRRGPDNRRD